jgi:quercetin dioxygenase-like cupin family protein
MQRLLPKDLKWTDNPYVHGLQTAVLFGDPSADGPYVARLKIPAHFRLEPHSHPDDARTVTVISGTLHFAFGEEYDEATLQAMPPGAFITEPKNMPHYAQTREEEVILEIHAIGPTGTKFVKER